MVIFLSFLYVYQRVYSHFTWPISHSRCFPEILRRSGTRCLHARRKFAVTGRCTRFIGPCVDSEVGANVFSRNQVNNGKQWLQCSFKKPWFLSGIVGLDTIYNYFWWLYHPHFYIPILSYYSKFCFFTLHHSHFLVATSYPMGSMYGIYASIGGILVGSMLPYIAAPWILWVLNYIPMMFLSTASCDRRPPSCNRNGLQWGVHHRIWIHGFPWRTYFWLEDHPS